jgi:hypothetical protein
MEVIQMAGQMCTLSITVKRQDGSAVAWASISIQTPVRQCFLLWCWETWRTYLVVSADNMGKALVTLPCGRYRIVATELATRKYGEFIGTITPPGGGLSIYLRP